MHLDTPQAINADHTVSRDYLCHNADGSVTRVRVTVDFLDLAHSMGREAHANKSKRATCKQGAIFTVETATVRPATQE